MGGQFLWNFMDQSHWARQEKYGRDADEDQFPGYDESTNSSNPLWWQESGRLWPVAFYIIILCHYFIWYGPIIWAIWYSQYTRNYLTTWKIWNISLWSPIHYSSQRCRLHKEWKTLVPSHVHELFGQIQNKCFKSRKNFGLQKRG